MDFVKITITVHGQSVHGSQPHLGNDAIVAASNIVLNAQLLISRYKNPLLAAMLTFNKVEAGSQFNIITDKAVLQGAMGTSSQEQQAELQDKLAVIVKNSAAVLGCSAQIAYEAVGEV